MPEVSFFLLFFNSFLFIFYFSNFFPTSYYQASESEWLDISEDDDEDDTEDEQSDTGSDGDETDEEDGGEVTYFKSHMHICMAGLLSISENVESEWTPSLLKCHFLIT